MRHCSSLNQLLSCGVLSFTLVSCLAIVARCTVGVQPATVTSSAAELPTTNFTTSGRVIMFSSSSSHHLLSDDAAAAAAAAIIPNTTTVFQIRGFSYSNYRIGEGPSGVTDGPEGFDAISREAICDQDFSLMRKYNVNTIKIYDFNVIANGINAKHKACLDKAWNNGVKPIFVILSLWFPTLPFPTPEQKKNTTDGYQLMVSMTADHPAVMGYSIGSEFGGDPNNNPALWKDFNHVANAVRSELNSTVPPRRKIITTGVYQSPCNPPVCTPAIPDIGHIINGEAAGAPVDVWGVDIYSPNPQESSLRESIYLATTKPFFFPEFGVWYQPPLNVTTQTELLVNQVEGLMRYSYHESNMGVNNNNTSNSKGNYDSTGPVYAGGLIFEWIDEYWKGGPLCTANPSSAQPYYGANEVDLRPGCTCPGNFSGVCATDHRIPRPILSNPSNLPRLWDKYVPTPLEL